MKITIEIDESTDTGLAPNIVYRRLREDYYNKLRKKHGNHYWGLETYCDEAARNLYAQIKNRTANVKSLILTYRDAEECFELFKQFSDVWVKNYERMVKENE